MNVVVYLLLILLTDQPDSRSVSQKVPVARNANPGRAVSPPVRGHRAPSTDWWMHPVNPHWCDQPARKLGWLNQMIQNAQSWPPYHYGWEVHQARYQGREVFTLNLCRECGQQRGFLIYNHYGVLVRQGEGADSLLLTHLTDVRLLANHPGRFIAGR